jgi:hypothetical protein
MYLIALYMGRTKGVIDKDVYSRYIDELKQIPTS